MPRRLRWFVIALFITFLVAGSTQARETTTIKGEAIKVFVKNFIEKNMPWPPGTLRLEFRARVSDVVAPMPKEKISYQIQNRGDNSFIGDATFAIGFYDDGVFLKEETVMVRMEVLTNVVVSSKTLMRDTKISDEDVHVIKKWFRRIPLNILTDVGDVVGKRLCASIRPNTVINREMLRDILIIKRGQLVRILLDTGLINITATGLSEEDGISGKMIRVKNTSSNKTIYARVINNSSVRIEF